MLSLLLRRSSLPVIFRNATVHHPLRYSSTISVAPGDHLHGFEVQQVRQVPDLQLTAVQLKHKNTGAEHLHIIRDDINNVFAVGFATPVSDSTGVPHILEHTTLCGSRRFPVRDPFFKMLNRSLATFMNAFTASDYTIYPFATTNTTDFENLRDVYMDAAFHPYLRELDFKQEGWRLEHEIPTDRSSPITFKGVVYNEMKGQMSDAGYLFYSRMQQQMFPGTNYQHLSGGDPANITDLTHEYLVNFHKTRYHPSNAKFYTYGSIPLETHLQAIDQRISQFSKIAPPIVNKIVKPFEQPRKVKSTCPPDPLSNPEKQTKISVSFLTNDSTDIFETFSMRVLSYLLLDGHSSPMYKALIETNLGSEFSANTGYDASTRISSFSIGLQGIRSQDAKLVEDKISTVLEEVQKQGFDSKRIEGALHQIEIGQKHKSADFGLTIMHGISSGWFNGTNPIDLLEVDKNIARLKVELNKGRYFESMISKYLISNPHTLVFTMSPDTEYAAKLTISESERLQNKIAGLTDADRDKIYNQGIKLLETQDKEEDLSCLPTLLLSDIAAKTKRVALDHSAVENTPVQWRTTSTNGITYFRAISTDIGLPPELKMYLPLFCDSLTYLGTRSRSMASLSDEIQLYTGGIRASTFLSTNHSDLDQVEEGIVLTGNCLDRNISRMYDLLTQLVLETNFDNVEKLRTLILGNASSLANSVADSGHAFARIFAASSLTPAMSTSELYGGMTQVAFMNKLAAEENISDIVEKLKRIASLVLKQSSLRVAITCGEESATTNESALATFLKRLPKVTNDPSHAEFQRSYASTFVPLPFAVNFSAKVFLGVPYTHADSPKLQVLSSLMTTHYLHKEIREKNGAYGGGAGYSSLGGLFSFYSYRDPRTLETLETYNQAIDWIQRRKFTEQEMVSAKLSIFQGIDAPVSVAAEGLINFAEGISDLLRQRRRESLLKVTEDDIKEVADTYLRQQESQKKRSVAILGERTDKITEMDGWKIFEGETTVEDGAAIAQSI